MDGRSNQNMGDVDYSLIEEREERQDVNSIQYKIETYQRIIREWSEALSLAELAVALNIMDRTVGWGNKQATISTGSIMNGGGVYKGMDIGRTKLFETLASLEKKKIIRRSLTRGGSSRISFNAGWTPDMLNIPKRLQNQGEKQAEKEAENDQFDPSVIRTDPSVTRTDPSVIRTLYTGTLSTGTLNTIAASSGRRDDNFPEKEKQIHPEDKKDKKTSKKSIEQQVEQAKQKTANAVAAKANRTRGRSDVSTGLEASWRAAMMETFPGVSIAPWSNRHRKNMKDRAKVWNSDNLVSFENLLDWAVRNWVQIMFKRFGWMSKQPAPKAPSIGFFINFCDTFLDTYAEDDLGKFLKSRDRTRLEQYMARGLSRDEAYVMLAKEQAASALREEMNKREAAAKRKLSQARMVREQARVIRETAPVPHPQHPRKFSRPKIVVRDDAKFDEKSFPILPKENPFK